MATISIVYFSGYGHTKKVAEAVLKGIQSVEGITAHLLTADTAMTEHLDTLNASNTIVLGCPTYMGGPAAQFKTFIDATSKIWMAQGWQGKLAAGFTNSGSPSGDKLNTLQSLSILAMQHGMLWVGTGGLFQVPSQSTPGANLDRLGSMLGLMTQSNHNEGPETAPGPLDLETAEHFGRRIAETTLRIKF